jgi:ACS family hexuronate transporter-like MFS transporter
MILAAMASTPIMAVVMMAVILGGFQFMMTNIQTIASDLQVGKSVGTLAGIGGAAAVCGTLIMTWLVPIITAGGNWVPFFIVGAALVPLSMLSVFIFGGKIEQTKSAE